jgi:NitT/TauT family transport system permease protein
MTLVFDNTDVQGETRKSTVALGPIVAAISGLALVVALWWGAGLALEATPRLSAFRGFSLGPTILSFVDLVTSGAGWSASAPSLIRIGEGLFWAFVIGAPVGLAMGSWRWLEHMLQIPFQILRMVSPLAWMPIAVLMFKTWDGAIVFLITAASIWPVIFSTAAGVKRIDPIWLSMANNLGGSSFGILREVILPAVSRDILQGLRLALGVAWIVLVPAEYLGVTSGLGYAINDARDTLSYDRLGALVLLIGLIGVILDSIIAYAIKHTQWTPTA